MILRPQTVSLLLFLLLIPGGAAAFAAEKSSCAAALEKAAASYELGLFEDVLRDLEPCGERGVRRGEATAAWALRAKALLALDRPQEARAAVAALLRADPAYEPGSPPKFARLVEEMRIAEVTAQTSSVSKTAESLREAPATVVVLTGEEIERRGYLDLEELLYDLPGFDVSRSNGEIYSSFYQRGLRSGNNDRNLLLVDGVEQNEQSTNAVLLSRQYALSNIDRVEVVYGPASTMYGANAYAGVINILTKPPEALIGDRRFGFAAQGAAGSFGTRFADLTLAGQTRSGDVAWSVSSRVHHSDEMDLSRFPDWDYDYSSVDYQKILRLEGSRATAFCGGESTPFVCRQIPSTFYRPVFDPQGKLLAVEATPEGEHVARELDRQFLARNNFQFSDPSDDSFFYGKLRISNVTVGLQFWRLKEGNMLTERARPGSDFGSIFTPRQLNFYVNFARSLGPSLSLRSLTRYGESWLDRRDSAAVFLGTYAGTVLGLQELIRPCAGAPPDPGDLPAGCPVEPTLQTVPLDTSSSKIHTELSLTYAPSERLNAIGGIDLRRSSIEGDLVDSPLKVTRDHTDLAAYVQASYKPHKAWKLVAGGRLDHNEIHGRPDEEGFGALFNSRLAAVYTPGSGRSVYKAIYSEAFKDPSDGEKFSTLPFVREFPSDGLRPERVRNFELAGDWQPAPGLSVGLAAYQAHYRDLVGVREITRCQEGTSQCQASGQLQNIGEALIRGVQAQFQYRQGRRELFANYTFTDPYQTDPRDLAGGPLLDSSGQAIDRLRIGDIASHRLNAGIDVFWSPRFSSDLRVSYVGPRKTGAGTTVPTNPFTRIDPYVLTHTTLSYRLPLRGSTLQLIVDNLFDVEVYHPGVGEAGIGFAERIPQPGRRIYLRLLAGTPGRRKSP